MNSRFRTILFDAGYTLVFPNVESLAEDLARQGYPITVQDFHAAERGGKEKLDAWLLPRIASHEAGSQAGPGLLAGVPANFGEAPEPFLYRASPIRESRRQGVPQHSILVEG